MIDTNAIRSKILSLALQGKMTEQLPEDGTAQDLYNIIQNEKSRLIEEKKIKKCHTTPVNKEEIPYVLPSNWMWVRIADVFSVINGDRGKNYPAKSTLSSEGIPFISAVNLDGKSVIEDDKLMCMTEEQYDLLSNGKMQAGDVIVCIRGSLGKHGMNHFDKGAIASSLVISRSLISDDIFGQLLMKYLDSELFYNEIKKYNSGVAQPNLAANNYEKFLFPLPPFDEQKRIVERLEETYLLLDTVEELQSQYASDLEVLKSKLIDAGIQGKLTEQLPEDGTAEELLEQIANEKKQLIKEKKIKATKALPEITEDEIPFEIPDNWKWVRLSEIMDVRDGTHDSPKYVEDGIPLVTSKNISSGGLDFTNVNYISQDDANKINERSNVDTGDILFAMIGTIGNPVIVEKDREFCIKNVALFKNFAKDKLDIRYVYWMLMREQYVMKKKAIGGLQPFISLKVFREYPVPLPPIAEQRRIADKLDDVISMC